MSVLSMAVFLWLTKLSLQNNYNCTVTGTQLIKKDCTVLSNNTAVTDESPVGCVTSSSGDVEWKSRYEENLPITVDMPNKAVQIRNITIGLELEGDVPSGDSRSLVEGIYECTSPQQQISLYIGLYANLNDYNVSFELRLAVTTYYPLEAAIECITTSYTPTHLYWSLDGQNITNITECDYDSIQIITDRFSSKYKNILNIKASEGCRYNGIYSCNMRIAGVSVDVLQTKSIEIALAESPTNLVIGQVESSQVSLQWMHDGTISVDRWCVYNETSIRGCTNDNTTSSIDIVVEPNANYTLLLVTIPLNALALPSHPESVHFSTIAPDAPQLVSLSTVNSTVLQIGWSMLNTTNLVKTFSIHKYDNCTMKTEVVILDTLDAIQMSYKHYLTNLQPATEYCLSIASSNPWGTSSNSSTVCNTTTANEISAPTVPPSIQIISHACSRTTVTWSPAPCTSRNGPLLHYNITYYSCSTGDMEVHVVVTTELFAVLTDISPHTLYCVRVARVNIGGVSGPFSGERETMTAQCPSSAPLALQYRDPSYITITVNWMAPIIRNSTIDRYLITYWSDESSKFNSTFMVIHADLPLMLVIEGLTPATMYLVEVQADNGGGLSNPNTINATTLMIGQVSGLSIQWLSNEMVRVTWQPLSPDATAIEYFVNYTINNQAGSIPQPYGHNVTVASINVTDIGNYAFTIRAAINASSRLYYGIPSTVTGCYGNCPSSKLQFGSLIGLVASLLIVVITIAVSVFIVCVAIRRRRKVTRYNNGIILQSGIAPSIDSELPDIHTELSEEVVVAIDISGFPTPDVTWYFNHQIIAEDNHYELEEDTVLLIHDIQLKHAGIYNFTASNSLGEVSGRIRVFVEGVTDKVDSPVLQAEKASCSVAVEDWVSHVEYLVVDGRYKEQFQSLKPCWSEYETSIACSPENKRRNRFKAVVPYNNNLVVLKAVDRRGDCSHTYINASYINGHSKKKQFIATQGPLPQTMIDFWRLVWQQNVQCIVMMLSQLAEGGMVRCQQYWPDSGSAYYGPYRVTLNEQEKCDEYKLRKFSISQSGGDTRHVHHYQFMGWPDHGDMPETTVLLQLCWELKQWTGEHQPPVVVHCSAGVGRTGVLVATMIGIDQGRAEGSIDMVAAVSCMRSQRMNMIQTDEQYILVHNAILEELYCGQSTIAALNLNVADKGLQSIDEHLKMTGYEAQLKALNALCPRPSSIPRNTGLSNLRRSRSDCFLPPDKQRVTLKKLTDDSDFIHASFLDGYNYPHAYIVAESPTKHTAHLFWEMILEQGIRVVVMLCDIVELGEDTCYPYWPASENSERHFGSYRVRNTSERVEQFVEIDLTVTDTKTLETNNVVLIQVRFWTPNGACSDTAGIICTVSRVAEIQRKTGNHTILVHCSDTVTRSGIFVSLYTAVEQCKIEQEVNIYKIVKSLKTLKPGLVPRVENYSMIFTLLLQYLTTEFDTYGNLQLTNAKCF